MAPLLTLICAYGYVYLRFGRKNFPFLLEDIDSDIEVIDDVLTLETVGTLSKRVGESVKKRDYSLITATHASLFIEEIGLAILEKNKKLKKPVLFELSLFFEKGSVLIIERDAGVLFDITDPNTQAKNLSSFVLNRVLEAHKEKAYLVTTGYNRNMIRLSDS